MGFRLVLHNQLRNQSISAVFARVLAAGSKDLTVGQLARLEGPWRPSTLGGGLAAREAEELRRYALYSLFLVIHSARSSVCQDRQLSGNVAGHLFCARAMTIAICRAVSVLRKKARL